MSDATANAAKIDEGWIRTASGGRFTFENPSPGEVQLEDIAQALSMQCRFNGHCPEFYSVAEHSVLVARLFKIHNGSAESVSALLHDAAEAYVGDLVAPLKRLLPEYDRYEARANVAIAARFGLPVGFADDAYVKRMDRLALAIECAALFGIDPEEWGFDPSWPYAQHMHLIARHSPAAARDEFLAWAWGMGVES